MRWPVMPNLQKKITSWAVPANFQKLPANELNSLLSERYFPARFSWELFVNDLISWSNFSEKSKFFYYSLISRELMPDLRSFF
jgi:hypothetical protein